MSWVLSEGLCAHCGRTALEHDIFCAEHRARVEEMAGRVDERADMIRHEAWPNQIHRDRAVEMAERELLEEEGA